MMNIVNVGYNSTNYYLIGQPKNFILIDVGFPGTFGQLMAQLNRTNVAFEDIRYLVITHYHPDHAGMVQELKEKGVNLLVLDTQKEGIVQLKTLMPEKFAYLDIQLDDNVNLLFSESRKFLWNLGIKGEIIQTPEHSDDSISLVLDDGTAFTGDLFIMDRLGRESHRPALQSWQKLSSLGVTVIYPGHGEPRRFSE